MIGLAVFLQQLLLQQVTFKHPNFVYSILASNLAPDFFIEVLWAGAGAFPGDCKAILQHQYAECQQLQLVRLVWDFYAVCFASLHMSKASTISGRKVMFAGDYAGNVFRSNASRRLTLGCDFFFDLLVVHNYYLSLLRPRRAVVLRHSCYSATGDNITIHIVNNHFIRTRIGGSG
nr:MAG TPA: hypothetical protein [Caudoviricetes sp.]